MSIDPDSEYLHVQTPILEVLLNKILEHNDNGAVVFFYLIASLRVARGLKNNFNLKYFTHKLQKPRSELLCNLR